MISIAKFHPIANATFSHYGTINGELHIIYTTTPKNSKLSTLDVRKVEEGERETIEKIIQRER
jgi:predicted transcriptional regulator